MGDCFQPHNLASPDYRHITKEQASNGSLRAVVFEKSQQTDCSFKPGKRKAVSVFYGFFKGMYTHSDFPSDSY